MAELASDPVGDEVVEDLETAAVEVGSSGHRSGNVVEERSHSA